MINPVVLANNHSHFSDNWSECFPGEVQPDALQEDNNALMHHIFNVKKKRSFVETQNSFVEYCKIYFRKIPLSFVFYRFAVIFTNMQY